MPTAKFYNRSNTYVPAIDNGEPVLSLAEALTRLHVVDPVTARIVEKGMVKLLNQISRTGGRIGLKDGRKPMFVLETGAYVRAGKAAPRLRVRFGKKLQQQVRDSYMGAVVDENPPVP